jgi:hypothetical protein
MIFLFWLKLSIKAAYIGGCWWRELLRAFFFPNWGISTLEGISQNRKNIYSWRVVEDLKRWIHTWNFVCGLKWGSSPYFGGCIHWKLFMLKAQKELYKTDKERMQVNRLLDIDSHPWCFVFVLKSGFEACCIHWTPLMLNFELVSQTRKVSLPAWRFSNLEKRTTSVERSRLILVDYLLNSYSRLRSFYMWCYFVVAEESLEVCRHRGMKCLHLCTFHCVMGNKWEAIWCVELVHRWVNVDLWPHTCYSQVVGWLLTCVIWTTVVMLATYVSNSFLYSNIW